MVILSFVCALILSILASALSKPQDVAKELDRSQQMLIAAQIFSPYGYFQVPNEKGEYVPAKVEEGGALVPSEGEIVNPSNEEILAVYRARIEPFLVNSQGESTTFSEAGIDENDYLNQYRKQGYYLQPWKLIYKIYKNPEKEESVENKNNRPLEGYVIPINGMGLWDAIYGYLAIKTDANTVIGISWYDQKETPGLGANIAEPSWQSQFPGKHLFQEGAGGQTQLSNAPLGITVVKGKVNEVFGDSPKALSAVDGMAGATLTGNGVTDAYKHVLEAYRPFLIRAHEQENSSSK
jgi:Na+-transporting NADH:ubiquinone oxidoreductase subunit C